MEAITSTTNSAINADFHYNQHSTCLEYSAQKKRQKKLRLMNIKYQDENQNAEKPANANGQGLPNN